jgi:hypothetical protein
MLKYQPKRFWGMLSKTKNADVGITAESFATFNEKLYFDECAPGDKFHPPEDIATAKISSVEVKNVLRSHFKANKSTGLSCLPL